VHPFLFGQVIVAAALPSLHPRITAGQCRQQPVGILPSSCPWRQEACGAAVGRQRSAPAAFYRAGSWSKLRPCSDFCAKHADQCIGFRYRRQIRQHDDIRLEIPTLEHQLPNGATLSQDELSRLLDEVLVALLDRLARDESLRLPTPHGGFLQLQDRLGPELLQILDLSGPELCLLGHTLDFSEAAGGSQERGMIGCQSGIRFGPPCWLEASVTEISIVRPALVPVRGSVRLRAMKSATNPGDAGTE
jgi:hypothetical protein